MVTVFKTGVRFVKTSFSEIDFALFRLHSFSNKHHALVNCSAANSCTPYLFHNPHKLRRIFRHVAPHLVCFTSIYCNIFLS